MRKLRLSVAVYLFPMLLGFTMVADASCCEGVLTGTTQVTIGTLPVKDGDLLTLTLLVDISGISNSDPPPDPDVDIYPIDLSTMTLTLDVPANVFNGEPNANPDLFFTGLDTAQQCSSLVQSFTLDDFTEGIVTDEVSGISVAL
jgi:hypothetical protein